MTICSFSPCILSYNPFSQYIPPLSRSFSRSVLHLAYYPDLSPSIVLHPFFGRRVVQPASSRTRNNAPVSGSLPSPWMNCGRIAQRHGGDTGPGLSDLRADRFGMHQSTTTKKTTRTRATTTPFDLASSTTPKTWTLGRQSYAVAHDHVGSSALRHKTRENYSYRPW